MTVLDHEDPALPEEPRDEVEVSNEEIDAAWEAAGKDGMGRMATYLQARVFARALLARAQVQAAAPLAELTAEQWELIRRAVNDYAMCVTDAAMHQSASRADIAHASALSALQRVRRAVEQAHGIAAAPRPSPAEAAGQVPAGWQPVPMEPTEAMLRAFGDELEGATGSFWELGNGQDRAYAAMLAAAPRPQQEGGAV